MYPTTIYCLNIINGNWSVPQDSVELNILSFSNVTARTLVSAVDQIFDVDFRYHNDDSVRKQLFHNFSNASFSSKYNRTKK